MTLGLGTRSALRSLHRIAGLLSSMLLIVIAGTGFLLLFRDQILHADYPQYFPESAVDFGPPSEWLDLAQDSAGHIVVDSIYAPYAAPFSVGVPIVVRHDHRQDLGATVVAIMPGGRTEIIRLDQSLAVSLSFLHTTLFVQRGEILAFATAILALFGISAGLLAWWPGRARALRTLRTPTPTWRLKLRLAHLWVGVLCWPLIVAPLLTGLIYWTIIWSGPASGAVAEPAACEQPLPLDARIDIALSHAPGLEFAGIQGASGDSEVFLRPKDHADAWRGGSTIMRVTECGEVRDDGANPQGLSDAAFPLLMPIHGGRIGGAPGQVLIGLASIGLLVLAFSGVWSYLSGLATRRR